MKWLMKDYQGHEMIVEADSCSEAFRIARATGVYYTSAQVI